MRIKWIVIGAGLAFAAFSGAAAAHTRVAFGLSIGVPAPIYAAPAPAYYAPPSYYPYYPAPRVAYYPPPVYYAPPSMYYAPAPRMGYGFRGGHRGHYRR